MSSPIIQLIVLAAIAIFLILRLRDVLGTREGFEKPVVTRTETERVTNRGKFEVIEGGPDHDISDHTDDPASVEALRLAIAPLHPSFAAMLDRFASAQVRAAATVGGNIANGSPIGDTPPALIALGATLQLRRGDDMREMPLEDFFLEYGKQDLAEGEFVEAVVIPRDSGPNRFRVYKLSKRFDQDISAVLGAFNVGVENGRVTSARIAFGGMAGVPKRAEAVEAALMSKPWTMETVREAKWAFAADFKPMSDMRASATYRLETAANLLERYFLDLEGQLTSVREVRA